MIERISMNVQQKAPQETPRKIPQETPVQNTSSPERPAQKKVSAPFRVPQKRSFLKRMKVRFKALFQRKIHLYPKAKNAKPQNLSKAQQFILLLSEHKTKSTLIGSLDAICFQQKGCIPTTEGKQVDKKHAFIMSLNEEVEKMSDVNAWKLSKSLEKNPFLAENHDSEYYHEVIDLVMNIALMLSVRNKDGNMEKLLSSGMGTAGKGAYGQKLIDQWSKHKPKNFKT